MYFSVQSFAPANPRPYDDTGWTYHLMRNVKVVAVENANSAADRTINVLGITELDVTGTQTGTGHITVLTNGWIALTEKTGDMRVESITSNFSDVLLYSPQRIVDATRDSNANSDVAGRNITLVAASSFVNPDASAVPGEVLRKPASLNEQEWEAMQKHPMLAGLMVSKVKFLEGALPILLYHHERYDGTGYPFGLQGEAIPLEARIFAVVDSYDAMTSDRPYRAAMSLDDALEEIRRNAGIQFDPEIVLAFTRIIQKLQPAAQMVQLADPGKRRQRCSS